MDHHRISQYNVSRSGTCQHKPGWSRAYIHVLIWKRTQNTRLAHDGSPWHSVLRGSLRQHKWEFLVHQSLKIIVVLVCASHDEVADQSDEWRDTWWHSENGNLASRRITMRYHSVQKRESDSRGSWVNFRRAPCRPWNRTLNRPHSRTSCTCTGPSLRLPMWAMSSVSPCKPWPHWKLTTCSGGWVQKSSTYPMCCIRSCQGCERTVTLFLLFKSTVMALLTALSLMDHRLAG